jgi:hypothetical protein
MQKSNNSDAIYIYEPHTPIKKNRHSMLKLTPQKIKHSMAKRNSYTQTPRRGLSKNQYTYNDSIQHIRLKLTPQKIKHSMAKRNGRNA